MPKNHMNWRIIKIFCRIDGKWAWKCLWNYQTIWNFMTIPQNSYSRTRVLSPEASPLFWFIPYLQLSDLLNRVLRNLTCISNKRLLDMLGQLCSRWSCWPSTLWGHVPLSRLSVQTGRRSLSWWCWVSRFQGDSSKGWQVAYPHSHHLKNVRKNVILWPGRTW